MKQGLQIKFIYSYTYSVNLYRVLNEDKSNFGKLWEDTKTYGSNFESYLKQYKSKILELIPEYSGYGWSEFAEPTIYVYPIHPSLRIPSFSHPLTLKVRENINLTLGVFIHELAHNNMNFKFPSLEIMEKAMATIAVKILETLNLSADSYRSFGVDVFEKRFGSKSAL